MSALRGMTLTVDVELVTEECCNCGVLFAMPEDLVKKLRRQAESGSFYCPNGHAQHYMGKSEEQKRREAERRAANAEEEARIARVEATNAKRAAIRAKNELKNTKRRAAAAVCPCCQRSFVQLRRHMKSQHPEHLEEMEIKS